MLLYFNYMSSKLGLHDVSLHIEGVLEYIFFYIILMFFPLFYFLFIVHMHYVQLAF